MGATTAERAELDSSGRRLRFLAAGLAALTFGFVVRCAWICDDAYITMRAVDNLVHGLGPTWNPGERVQVFTHPLWMVVLTAFYAVLRDPYWTLLAASLLTTLVFLLFFVRWFGRGGRGGILALVVLGGSKSFVDFSTSGLENPLTNLLILCAAWLLLERARDPRRLAGLALVAGLGAANRIDSLLFFLPPLAAVAAAELRARGALRVLATLAAGFLPFLAWEAFSLFYFGSLVPNTAYAKLATGLGLADYAGRGGWYLLYTIVSDPAGVLALVLVLALSFRRATRHLWPLGLGVLLGIAYPFRIGGDFMLGRLYAAPIVLSACWLARAPLSRAAWRWTAGALVLAALVAPLGPWRSGPGYDASRAASLGDFRPTHGVQDERGAYFPTTGLLRAHTDFQNEHPWIEHGRRAHDNAERGPLEPIFAASMGMPGFHAGPEVRVYDLFGLADPLLARLPMQDDANWKPGHYLRRLPAGYALTRRTGENHLQDPALSAFYDELLRATSGELWTTRRMAAVWRLHVGAVRDGFRDYCERYRRREVALDP